MNFGVVAEFNPFHNGHKFLIESLKKTDSDTVTVVMSESFVQRGECACMSPNARTRAALLCGADLVLSLPVPFATASAERFALGGVGVLGALGCVDTLAFGSESGNARELEKCAQLITDNRFSEVLEKYLDEGFSFPVSRQKALEIMGGISLSRILSSPNDILGIEYIKAIKKLCLNMGIFPVTRKGAVHDGSVPVGNMCSASALRRMMNNNEDYREFLPKESCDILINEIKENRAPGDYGRLETAILYKLRTMKAEDFKELPDISEGLEYRFSDAVRNSVTLDEILEKVKTKRYTYSRLRRIVLCAFLGIKKADVTMNVPYIRVLGFNEKGAKLLKKAKDGATLPIVTKSSDINALNEDAKRTFALESLARDLFSLALPQNDICGREMTDKIIVI